MEVLIPITFFVSVAAVLILRPITRRIGARMEVPPEPRTLRQDDAGDQRVVALLEMVNRRLELLEERIDFTERLVAGRKPARPELIDTASRQPTRL